MGGCNVCKKTVDEEKQKEIESDKNKDNNVINNNEETSKLKSTNILNSKENNKLTEEDNYNNLDNKGINEIKEVSNNYLQDNLKYWLILIY